MTVGEGRVVYKHGRDLRVAPHPRRPRPRAAQLPAGEVILAAGSFGVAIAITAGERVKLYRLPWRTIDKTLTAPNRIVFGRR